MSMLVQAPSKPLEIMSDSEMNMTLDAQPCKRKHAAEVKSVDRSSEETKRIRLDKPATPNRGAAGDGLVQLRNGRLTLKQKPTDWSRSMSTLGAILAFNTYLATCTNPLQELPSEHLHMVAKLVQESDKNLADAAKAIRKIVLPSADEDVAEENEEGNSAQRILTLTSITKAIESVAKRVNYGVETTLVLASSSEEGHVVPASLQLWRWEVIENEQLATENREKILARREERVRAREEAFHLLVSLSEEERISLLTPRIRGKSIYNGKGREGAAKGRSSVSSSCENVAVVQEEKASLGALDDEGEEAEFTTPSPTKKPLERFDTEEESRGSLTTSPSKASKSFKKSLLSPEQEARLAELETKRKLRETRKAEKAHREALKEAKKQKEAQQTARAANFLSSFIQRPRSASPVKTEQKIMNTTVSDFDRVFQACRFKDLAPVNRFFVEQNFSSALIGRGERSRDELLQEFKAKHVSTRSVTHSRRGIHPSISVRESMRLITEASVMGDEKLEDNGKRGLLELSDRKRVPMKLLHFQSDRRPAWYGTWTRKTNLIGGRRPLGQDPVALDYTYDSDAEWEDVDPNDGDDVQDHDERDEDEAIGSDDNFEMDDWLVDDLEEEEQEEEEPYLTAPEDLSLLGLSPSNPLTVPYSNSSQSLKSGDCATVLQPKRRKKFKTIGRRFESKLVPFSTGPHWEDKLGETSYDGFKVYQIQFLNGAHPGVDPFTFQSLQALPLDSMQSSHPEDGTFVNGVEGLSRAGASKSTSAHLSKARAFPTEHLPALLMALEESQAGLRPMLVEELKVKFAHLGKAVTKASIEGCINVYAEKTKKMSGATYTVKEQYRRMAGVAQVTSL